jgi:hypothetical protein
MRWTRCFTLLAPLLMLGCAQEQIDAGNQAGAHLMAAGSGIVSKLAYPGAGLMGDDSKSFLVHGRWCGKGFPSDAEIASKVRMTSDRARNEVALVKSDLFPVDEVDLVCARHDLCYLSVDGVKQTAGRGDCDVVLMCGLQSITESSKDPEAIKNASKVLAWAGGASWRIAATNCQGIGFRRMKQIQFVADRS